MPLGIPKVKTEDAIQAADEATTEDQKLLKKQANARWVQPPKGTKLVSLTIDKPEGDQGSDIFVSVNFRDYQIKYGEPVTVPEEVVSALKDTIITTVVQDPATEKLRAARKARFSISTEAA